MMNILLTGEDKIAFKTRLLQLCTQIIEDRISMAKAAMNNAQEAANSEEKSSAGDKYETSRAMSHLEKDMHARQLQSNQNELAALAMVNCKILYHTVSTGTYIVGKDNDFFIAAGLGKIQFEERTIYLLSPNAPLAKSLVGRNKGEVFEFNTRPVELLDVF